MSYRRGNNFFWLTVVMASFLGAGVGFGLGYRGSATEKELVLTAWERQQAVKAVLEAGERAAERLILEQIKTQGTVDKLLGTIHFGWVGNDQYAIMILDNHRVGGIDQDGDDDPFVDRDHIIRVIVTASSGSAQRVSDSVVLIQGKKVHLEWLAWRNDWW